MFNDTVSGPVTIPALFISHNCQSLSHQPHACVHAGWYPFTLPTRVKNRGPFAAHISEWDALWTLCSWYPWEKWKMWESYSRTNSFSWLILVTERRSGVLHVRPERSDFYSNYWILGWPSEEGWHEVPGEEGDMGKPIVEAATSKVTFNSHA